MIELSSLRCYVIIFRFLFRYSLHWENLFRYFDNQLLECFSIIEIIVSLQSWQSWITHLPHSVVHKNLLHLDLLFREIDNIQKDAANIAVPTHSPLLEICVRNVHPDISNISIFARGNFIWPQYFSTIPFDKLRPNGPMCTSNFYCAEGTPEGAISQLKPLHWRCRNCNKPILMFVCQIKY